MSQSCALHGHTGDEAEGGRGLHGNTPQIGAGTPTYRERHSATNRELPGDLDTGWPHPVVVRGRLYIRAKNKVLCYDIRQAAVPQEETAGEALSAFGDTPASEKSTQAAELSLLIPPAAR